MASPLSPDPSAGVFETLLVAGGRPVELDAHLQRMARSARELYGVEVPRGARELVLERSLPLQLGRLRLNLVPSPGGPVAEAVTAEVSRADVFPGWERAATLRCFEVPGGLGAHKWSDRSGLAAMESELPRGCVALLLDTGGVVLEGSRANVFAVEGEVLVTPPADGRILPGVARARAIEAARSLGLQVLEQELPLERLTAAPEAFLTGSVRGVEPVRAVGEARLGRPGDATAEIVAAIERLWLGRAAA